MKKLVCLLLSILFFSYGICYLEKTANESPPNVLEYFEFLNQSKENTLDFFREKFNL